MCVITTICKVCVCVCVCLFFFFFNISLAVCGQGDFPTFPVLGFPWEDFSSLPINVATQKFRIFFTFCNNGLPVYKCNINFQLRFKVWIFTTHFDADCMKVKEKLYIFLKTVISYDSLRHLVAIKQHFCWNISFRKNTALSPLDGVWGLPH